MRCNKKANFMVQSDLTGNDHIWQKMDITFWKDGKHTWSETKLIWQACLVPSVVNMASIFGPPYKIFNIKSVQSVYLSKKLISLTSFSSWISLFSKILFSESINFWSNVVTLSTVITGSSSDLSSWFFDDVISSVMFGRLSKDSSTFNIASKIYSAYTGGWLLIDEKPVNEALSRVKFCF